MKQIMSKSTSWPSIIVLISSVSSALTRECPCSNPDLCKPVTGTPDQEFYLWTVKPKLWKQYDWSRITTVANYRDWDDELLCFAHSKGVRVVITSDFPIDKLNDSSIRWEWVLNKTMYAVENFADGINIDIEGVVAKNTTEVKLLTELVQQTASKFKESIPGAQVSFDVPHAPGCVYGRCYDYKAIADAIDFLVIMDYDMAIQGRPCTANANSPYHQIVQGIDEYKKIGINLDKLVLAVPWYGYAYLCNSIDTTNDTCYITCGGAGMHSVFYSKAQDLLLTRTDTGRKWHEPSLSPYFFYTDEYGNIYQVWYDDPSSLSIRYKYALETAKMRGIGAWNADLLDYSGLKRSKMQTQQMWETFSNTQRWYRKPKI